MKKGLIVTTILALLVIFVVACDGVTPPATVPTLTPTPNGEGMNFRLWVSDEVNAIDDFDELWVTITQIGMHQGGESSEWVEYDLDPEGKVDLTKLKGDNAIELWSGELNDGTYTKVFIYVSDVEGVLAGGEVNIKLPGGKLQISKPFEVTGDDVIDFVYDITVIEAGKSGKYILKPQIAQSGSDQAFIDVASNGKPEDKGKPDDKGGPEGQEIEGPKFEGTIDVIDGSNWTMMIDGETKTVDVSGAEIVGEPAVGLEAEIKGTEVDDTIVASEVEIKEPEGGGN